MSLGYLFSSEAILLLESIFIGGLFLFFIVNRDFTRGIYIWLLVVLFFKYQKMDFSNSVLPDVSMIRILFIFLAGVFFMEILSKRRRILPFRGIDYSMVLFCLFAIISMIWTGFIFKDGGRLRVGELLTGFIFPFFMFFVSKNVYDTHKKREGFIKFIMLVGSYLALTAFFEHFRMYGLVWPRYILDPSIGIHFNRARGPFTQAAVNGTALGFALVASFYFLLVSKKMPMWRGYAWLLVILMPFAIFFTYTRAPWIAAILGMGVIFIFTMIHNRKIFILAMVLLCVAGLLGMSFLDDEALLFASKRATNENPVYDRLNLYVASGNMFMHHPVFGVGFGRFSDHVAGYFRKIDGIPFSSVELSEHDTFAGILAEMGIIGILLILSVYLLILSKSIRLYKYLDSHADRVMIVVFWAFMSVYIINSMFIEMRYFEFVNCLFFIYAGIICGWERTYSGKIA